MSDSNPSELEVYEEDNLKTKHLWLIIGVNAIISVVVSLLVVLIIGPWLFNGAIGDVDKASTGEGAGSVAEGTPLDSLASPTSNLPPTPTPTPEPQLYTVVEGDSLSLIAARFEVSMIDIMQANGFNNPDFIKAGQVLLIPIGGLPDETATPVNIPPTETPIDFEPPTAESNTPPDDITITSTPIPTTIPTPTAPPLDKIIVKISNVLGYGQIEQEMVIITNEGPGVNLSGWQLTGSRLKNYAFPNLFLWSGGSVRVHTKSGANTPSDLYWGQSEAHWFSGDTITLEDEAGEIIAAYPIP